MNEPCTHDDLPTWGCPICTAARAVDLLRTGRPAQALKTMEGIPALVRIAVERAYAQGHATATAAWKPRTGDRPSWQRRG